MGVSPPSVVFAIIALPGKDSLDCDLHCAYRRVVRDADPHALKRCQGSLRGREASGATTGKQRYISSLELTGSGGRGT